MKRFLVMLVFGILISCNYFEPKEERTQKIIASELEQIDWNTVDAYPLFYDCDESAVKEEQRSCFESKLTSHFKNTLKEFEFTIDADTDPKVNVIFVVNSKGRIIIKRIEKDPSVIKQMPEFDGIISQSLKNLPTIAPAIKRGIPVSTKFSIPIKLNRRK
ncbi:hypothetical protein [Maribacter sp. 2304DJ31-5]|uniref:hypothetical protein n=1 Tax=Maribacter sp. 2304DJ31-5 TaxID=3386273 RepID=UPI0039BCDA3D